MCQRNGSGGPGNRALLSLRTGAGEAGRYGVHAAGANVCGLRTMPAVALTMRSAHAAPLTTLCSTPPATTGLSSMPSSRLHGAPLERLPRAWLRMLAGHEQQS
jgi:hypothetical protein